MSEATGAAQNKLGQLIFFAGLLQLDFGTACGRCRPPPGESCWKVETVEAANGVSFFEH
jgi:hypothetical protein